MNITIRKAGFALAVVAALGAGSAGAGTTYTDNFTGNSAQQDWIPLVDACLTAGNGSGSVPACAGKKDTKGNALPTNAANQGALLLTPAVNSQTGAILSNFTFPMSQGLQVTFTTYSYGSTSNGAPANIGADGIVFFLTDGTKPVPSDTGASGGAMGYGCSYTNTAAGKKWNGLANAYLGLGMDEWGNFLNDGDNSGDGVLNTNAAGAPPGHGGNGWSNNLTSPPGDSSGWNYQPNRIGMRGAGNVNFAALNALNDTYYSTDDSTKIAAACHSGKYQAKDGTQTPLTYDYYAIPGAYKALPENQPLAHPSAKTLATATPITYKVSISAGGVLNFLYSYNNGDFQPVLTNSDISKINGTPPSAFRFGFSAGTGGQNNVHEITCFTASPLQANSSAGANTVTGKVTGNTQFFLASYSNGDWWGSLVADPLVIQADGTLNVGTAANWDAKCVLTGATPCDSMSVIDPATGKATSTHDVTVQDPSTRNLLTSSALGAGNGVALNWTNLSTITAIKNALSVPTSNASDATPGQNRVAWLRGDRTVEQLATGCTATATATPPCDMRTRTYVLGDIINSSPTFVGAPTAGAYPDTFYDQLSSKAGPEAAYSTFAANNATRTNVVYVGSNDGFVHGFEAGNYKSDGTFNTATNDGKELVGYMPYDVLLNKAVNLANPLYVHDYLVDATPAAGDVYYGGAWHTWLAGGVGSSGQEIYALDITNPSSPTVIGDWDSSTSTLTHLGNTVGAPIIARMHNGQWAIIFGSGLHKNNDGTATANANTTAGVYIGLIDPTTGAVTFQFLDTKVGSAASPDGIAYVTSADLDGDHIADYLYAGDTQGNVWRFDVTNKLASKWVSTAPFKLFVAQDASGNPQPITTSITATVVQTGTASRVMLFFGTGQQRQATGTAGVQYATGQQSFYGIWDWNMDLWNGMSTNAKVTSISSGAMPVTRDNLLAQSVDTTLSDATHRYISNTKVVCWKGDTTATAQCPLSADTQYGWVFDLPDTGPSQGSLKGQQEQVIYNPTLIEGAIVVNTAIPPEISAAQCKAGLQSGWTMAFNPATGGGFTNNFFADAGGGFGGGASTVSGTMVSGVGTPTSVQYGGKSYVVTQTITGGAKLFPVNPQEQINPSRVSWRELVNP